MIYLNSTFIDYYDDVFTSMDKAPQDTIQSPDFVFHRPMQHLSKPDQLKLLSRHFRTPTVHKKFTKDAWHEWCPKLTPGRWYVAYEDLDSHCAEGKVLLRRNTEDHYDYFAHFSYVTEFIPPSKCIFHQHKIPAKVGSHQSYISPFTNCSSFRILRVGSRWYEVKYSGPGWASNVKGTFSAREINRTGFPNFNGFTGYHLPMEAIDFIITQNYNWYAIDHNCSPGLTPIKHLLSKDGVLEELQWWFKEKDPQGLYNPMVNI